MAARHPYILQKEIKITEIIFTNASSLQNVEKIVFFKETRLTGNWLKKEFQYSFDNVTWTSWKTFSQNAVRSIVFSNNPNFWIRVKYTRQNYNTANINDLYIFYDSEISSPHDVSTGIIDADLLQGKPGSYYLDRANHFGPYTDLEILNMDGSGVPVYNHREDSSDGTDFYFNRIEGRGSVLVTQEPGKVVVQGTVDASGNAVYQNPDPVVNTVGGIEAGETFFDTSTGKTFAETMEAMFYPVLYPTLTSPSNTFSQNKGSLREIAESLNITFSATFSRGAINPQYPPTASSFRSGLPNTYIYTGSGLPATVLDTALANNQFLTGYTVLKGIQSWTSRVSYDAGVQPYDSKGNAYDNPLPAGNTSIKSVSFEGVYPLFGTTVNISTLTKQPLVSMINGNNIEFDMVTEGSGVNKQTFEVANDWLNTRNLIGVETWNDFSNRWEYQGGTATTSLIYWTSSSSTENIQGINVNYTKYTYNGVDRGAIKIRLKF